MRRGSWMVLALGAAGCSGMKDMMATRPEVAAEAAGQQLKVERLAELMTRIKGVPLTREAAGFVANMWVDHTLFAQALASGRALTDSASAAAAMWPDLAEIRGSRWHETLINRRAPMSPAVADSIFNKGEVRLLQHILFRVDPNAEPPAREAARRKADAALQKLKGGADFAKLAGQVSEDPGSNRDGGYLVPAPKGKWVTAFDSAGWTLAPGAMTGVVETPFGYHIIRRPPAAEVQNRLVEFARDQIGATLDSAYLDSLGTQHKLKVESSAPATMRKAITDLANAPKPTTPLATYDGGALTIADFMRWSTALGPVWGNQLLAQPDTSLAGFARLIAQNQLLLRQADSAGITVTAVEWAGLMQRYQAQIDTLRMSLDLSAGDLSDPATPAADRAKVAAIKVESYWDRIATGANRPRPIPGQIAAVLRTPGAFSLNTAGLARAVEVATALKAKADSAAKAPQPVPNQPAPGAAPTGAGPVARP